MQSEVLDQTNQNFFVHLDGKILIHLIQFVPKLHFTYCKIIIIQNFDFSTDTILQIMLLSFVRNHNKCYNQGKIL
jgi:hypothetical protein